MNVLFIVLNEPEYLDAILDSFVEIGVKGATILDSQGMGSAITNSGSGREQCNWQRQWFVVSPAQ